MVSSLLSTAMTMYLVLAVSVFLYGTFYYAYTPVELANIPVIFLGLLMQFQISY